jgi:hypothetical protein
MTAAHIAMGGKFVGETGKPWEYSRQNAEQIQVFQHAGADASLPTGNREISGIERWIPIDESANGFRLQRSSPGSRVTLRQLVALCPHAGRHYLLGEVRWLLQNDDQSLQVGILALPGLGTPCTLRQAIAAAARPDAPVQGFLFQGGGDRPRSVVIPSGWYQRDRSLDYMLDGESAQLRLCDLLGRGFDYDWASFNSAG